MSPNTILPTLRSEPWTRNLRRWLRFHQQTVMVVALTGLVGVAAVAATVGVVSTVGERIPNFGAGAARIATPLR